jgi:hypothetical protein
LSGLIGSDVVATTASITNPVYSTSGAVAAGAYAQSASTTLTGTDSANYTLAAFSTNGSNYTVNRLNLSVTGLNANNKTYNATTAATLTGTASVSALTNDLVSVGGTAIASFASANVGAGIGVTVAGYTLIGHDAANYSVVQPTGLTANITPAPLIITANSDAKLLTTTDSVGTYKGVNYTGLVGGELSSVVTTGTITRTGMGASSGSGDAANIYTGVLVPSGYSSSNYTISYVNGDYKIIPAEQLLVNVANKSVVYGTAPIYSITSAQYLDGINVLKGLTKQSASGNTSTWTDGAGGTVSFTLASASDLSTSGNQKVGNYAIVGTNTGITGSNFTALNFIGNLEVTQTPLTANASNVSKPYDGNVAMNGVTIGLTGKITNDVVTVSGSGAFSSPRAGTGLTYSLSNLALGGTDASNYYLSGGTQLSGSNGVISPVALTATLSNTGITKVYDGTVTAPAGFVSAFNIAGLVTGDAGVASVSLSNTGSTYASANAGAGFLTLSGLSISSLAGGLGSLPSDYVLSANSITTPAAITKAPLTATVAAPNKSYDGTTSATPTLTITAGLVSGETVTATGTASFNSKDVLTANLVTMSANSLANGTGLASNYSLATGQTVAANITAKTLMVTGLSSANQAYNGTTVAALSGTAALAGRVGSETFALNGATGLTGTLASKNAGSQGVTSSLALGAESGGAIVSNYALTQPTLSSVTIAQALLTVSATADTKTYNGNTASAALSIVTSGTVFTGDTLPTLTQVFNGQNVVGTTGVTPNSVIVSDSNGGANYQVTLASAAGTITAKALTITGTQALSKVYDRSAAASFTLGSLTGFVDTETVTAAASGSFDSSQAGSRTATATYTLANGSVGGLASN